MYKRQSVVWSVASLPCGDLVTGCADGNAYVWTRVAPRAAAIADQEAFKASVEAVAIPQQQASADGMLDPSMIKEPSALETPGQKEGQQLIVKDEGGKIWLYSWSMVSASWQKVGEVTGSAGDAGGGATMGKHWYEGQKYDYLFDLDINGIKMKLPFNRGDDPWMAAQKWI